MKSLDIRYRAVYNTPVKRGKVVAIKDNWKKIWGWLAGLVVTGVVLILTEGSLMATARIYGPFKATLMRVAITIPLSRCAIYLSSDFSASRFLRTWYARKEAELSKTAKMAVEGGKALAIINAGIFLGPILATILMLMLGFRGRRVYAYAALLAFLCAGVWCSFYSGLFWGLDKAFAGR